MLTTDLEQVVEASAGCVQQEDHAVGQVGERHLHENAHLFQSCEEVKK